MTKITGYYTAGEIEAMFGWHRSQVSATAKREGWQLVAVGKSHLYAAQDVEKYGRARDRTRLAKSLGWWGMGMCRDSQVDMVCPICGGHAVRIGDKWRCVNGDGN